MVAYSVASLGRSPVGVMILARGDLNIDEGKFTPGIKNPNCRRYFNVYHPIDPVAYRIEPLIKQEMHDKEPVQLLQVLRIVCRNTCFLV